MRKSIRQSRIQSRQVSRLALLGSKSRTWLLSGAQCLLSQLISLPSQTDTCMFRTNNYNYDWDWMTSFEGDMGPYLQYADVRLTHKNPELLPAPEQIAAWSCSYSALRSRSRARGRLSWSRARRTSSGRGCSYVFVCAGRAWDWDTAAEHSTVGVHVRDGGVRNSVSSLPLWYSCILCAVGTYNAAKESKR